MVERERGEREREEGRERGERGERGERKGERGEISGQTSAKSDIRELNLGARIGPHIAAERETTIKKSSS